MLPTRPPHRTAQRQNSKAVKAERTHGPNASIFERPGPATHAGSVGNGGGGGGGYHLNRQQQQQQQAAGHQHGPSDGDAYSSQQPYGQHHLHNQSQPQQQYYPGLAVPHGGAISASSAGVGHDSSGPVGAGEGVFSRIGRWLLGSSRGFGGGQRQRAHYYYPPQHYGSATNPYGSKFSSSSASSSSSSSSSCWSSGTVLIAGCALIALVFVLGGSNGTSSSVSAGVGAGAVAGNLPQGPSSAVSTSNLGRGGNGGSRAGGSSTNGIDTTGIAASPQDLARLRKAAVPPSSGSGDTAGTIRIFHAVDFDDNEVGSAAATVPVRRLAAMLGRDQGEGYANDNNNIDDVDDGNSPRFEFRTYDPSSRRSFLATYGHLCYDSGGGGTGGAFVSTRSTGGDSPVLQRYDNLAAHPSLQLELWKACMLYLGHGNAYVDATDVALVQTFRDAFLDDGSDGRPALSGKFAIEIDPGTAAEGDDSSKDAPGTPPPLMVHPSLLILPEALSSVPLGVIRLLVETSNQILESSPLLLPREQRRLIDADDDGKSNPDNELAVASSGSTWTILSSRCVRLADPSVTVRSLWAGVKLFPSTTDLNDGLEVMEGSIAQQLGPGTDAAISGERYGTSRLYPNRHGGLHVQTDSESSLVHTSVTPDANSRRVSRHCVHPSGGMCCEVYSPSEDNFDTGEGPLPLLLVRHPVSGRAMENEVPTSDRAGDPLSAIGGRGSGSGKMPPLPYLTDLGKVSTVNNVTYSVAPNEAPFMTTVREILLSDPSSLGGNGFTRVPTPNFFDILLENDDCLPTSKACQSCLKRVRDGKGHDCKSCAKECGCYCKVLCKIRPPEKIVVKEYLIYPPAIRKDGDRLVPRIVHQTWYEPVTKEKYPNMSRLIESWKRSGWEYNFYDDDTAGSFLSTHFPPEVREAYDAVLPGAFKADLFRYCVLLIRGGVYADMDVLLESNLDAVVSGDVGFMVPMDSPGTKIGRRSCLWNGLMAVAPGHPFLAKTIELVVNNIRNRFTSVDYDDMLCPNPVFQISHSVDTLFTCGPCILGGAINAVLGRHMQEPYEPGDIDIWGTERMEQSGAAGDGDVASLAGMEKKEGIVVSPDDQRLLIPGRTIILQQNKADMGAHRFTWVEKNLMVAATDMPDYDDRPPTLVHYSKTHGKAGVYGVKKLYTDNIKADEKIRLVVQPV